MIASAAPILDLARLERGSADRMAFAHELVDAFRTHGFFYVANHSVGVSLCRALLARARAFFALPAPAKDAIHIDRSLHFRGYSTMKNERDWREQLHFASEGEAASGGPAWRRLEGPNLWPAALGAEWRATVLEFMDAAERLGASTLEALAVGLGLPVGRFAPRGSSSPHRLLKLICYHEQPTPTAARRGVAPHCDWSWITLLLQDAAGGLEVQRPDGSWAAATPVPDSFVVTVGELVEVVTGGFLRATPHRVVNRSATAQRLSAPFFVNPPLDALVVRDERFAFSPASGPEAHAHRVKPPALDPPAFRFGASEWRRKGLRTWCWSPDCVGRA